MYIYIYMKELGVAAAARGGRHSCKNGAGSERSRACCNSAATQAPAQHCERGLFRVLVFLARMGAHDENERRPPSVLTDRQSSI
jgi:hypothetical protein